VTTLCYDAIASQAKKACRYCVRIQLTAADMLIEFVSSLNADFMFFDNSAQAIA
jgi:hypothetical protein